MTQDDIAKVTNKTVITIKRYESGQSLPDIAFLESLKNAYNISPEWLSCGTGNITQDIREIEKILTVLNNIDSMDILLLQEIQQLDYDKKNRLYADLKSKKGPFK